ncbi:MAG: ABC transporter ATP-binding protein [Thermoleophilaceae bacterium]|nr:ABC transporter ATP-binding protein [Thermoleophilaceae bacterium]
MHSVSIRAEGVGVRFLFDRYQRAVTPALARLRRRGTETWGLREMAFAIGPGEGVALIGPSGSGKTTVLRLIAGVLSPDAGRLDVNGRVGSLLSTEAGLLGLLTGRENATLLGVLAGMSRAQSEAALDEVKHATHLADAFDRPVLSYSEGMKARLGFAVADHTGPDILVLDEVHEALDHEFRQIVAERAHLALSAGGVVVAAGHDHPLLATFCDRALWLADGHIAADGPFEEVRRAYLGQGA